MPRSSESPSCSTSITLEQPSERSGRIVAETGNPLASWIGDFLRDPDQQDVLNKLERSGALERHAFVFLPGFTTAPFSVSDLLMGDDASLPVDSPRLPDDVTHVWAVSTWSSAAGFHCSRSGGWSRFAKSQPAADHHLSWRGNLNP